MNNKNGLIEEIKSFLKNEDCSYDKDQLINEECVKGIQEIKDIALDEIGVEYDGKSIMVLEDFTDRVFDNVIQMVCNVLDSYKEK
ncbi:hypothetical protein EXM63_02520 [Clostridium botulinum]|uniref:Uncharacterized protein n=1 Tax=Clostridium botulinum TaxID=1491 RepID=A0A6M0SX54_CLOBO|nr:hypothetical protein [Clostridium botulinum]NFI74335.1 hypothetical protein [Clostridium sporogenes]NFP62243.1 hypothetical protein [Clostridium sporogenes]NFU95605.1 hypothetical protein [Clostridium sporogenes]NFV67938.1 hypothetical protein [Clostridium botulinum]